MNQFEKNDESIHELIEDILMNLVNLFLSQFKYDLNQDRHQETLTFIDIHTQIDSKFGNGHMNQFMNRFKNQSLVNFQVSIPQLYKSSPSFYTICKVERIFKAFNYFQQVLNPKLF